MSESAANEASAPLRTFISADLPSIARDALGEIQAELIRRATTAGLARAVRWTRPESIHLTLKFLGETPGDLVPRLGDRLRGELARASVVALRLSTLGVFPNARGPRVIWVGLAGDLASLGQLQRSVEVAVSPLGFPPERRPFSPHLTLGRVNETASPRSREEIGRLVLETSPPPSVEFVVGEVSLMRSELTRGGAIYTRLDSFTFLS
jgi:RNA 2',3'-cyclic 3'-phosphodiesterase